MGPCGDGDCLTRRTGVSLCPLWSRGLCGYGLCNLLCSLLFDLDQKFQESCLPYWSPWHPTKTSCGPLGASHFSAPDTVKFLLFHWSRIRTFLWVGLGTRSMWHTVQWAAFHTLTVLWVMLQNRARAISIHQDTMQALLLTLVSYERYRS